MNVHLSSYEAYSFATDGYEIFLNVHTNLGACCTHEGVSGTKQVYTRVDLELEGLKEKLSLTLPRQGIEIRMNVDAVTSERHPQCAAIQGRVQLDYTSNHFAVTLTGS